LAFTTISWKEPGGIAAYECSTGRVVGAQGRAQFSCECLARFKRRKRPVASVEDALRIDDLEKRVDQFGQRGTG
jgi:hypothetical protein